MKTVSGSFENLDFKKKFLILNKNDDKLNFIN